ncbi:hypothetical protein JK206_15280 [Gluconobacter cerinus]|nr:hypothetical protein [Gluconobacter cerinus]
MGQQKQSFHRGLSHEDAVKRIPMHIRKLSDRYGMLTGDGQFLIAVFNQTASQQMGINLEIWLSRSGTAVPLDDYALAFIRSRKRRRRILEAIATDVL